MSIESFYKVKSFLYFTVYTGQREQYNFVTGRQHYSNS